MNNGIAKRLDLAVTWHVMEVEAANDRLLAAFESIVMELLGGRKRFQAVRSSGDIEAGLWYAPALDYLYVSSEGGHDPIRVELSEYGSEEAGEPDRFITLATGAELLDAMGVQF